MKDIIFSGKELTLLTYMAELNGTRVSDIIYKIVYDKLTGKNYKTIKNKRLVYYFNPQKIYDDLEKQLEKYINQDEDVKRGFKMSRKRAIQVIINRHFLNKELVVKESLHSTLKTKGGKIKTAKQNEKLMQTSFSGNGEIKTSPISIPKQ